MRQTCLVRMIVLCKHVSPCFQEEFWDCSSVGSGNEYEDDRTRHESDEEEEEAPLHPPFPVLHLH